MNPRSPTSTLSPVEGRRVRELMRARGPKEAARLLGNICEHTAVKAAAEIPIARLSAEVIRMHLDRHVDRI